MSWSSPDKPFPKARSRLPRGIVPWQGQWPMLIKFTTLESLFSNRSNGQPRHGLAVGDRIDLARFGAEH